MKQIELVIQNQTGLHARPAKVLVNLAKQFKSRSVSIMGQTANAKSMVSVLTLGAGRAEVILPFRWMAWMKRKRLRISKPLSAAGLGDNDNNGHAEAKPAPVKVEAPVSRACEASDVVEPGVIKGVGAAPGIAVGPLFHFKQVEFDLDRPETLSASVRMELSEALDCAKERSSSNFISR